MQNKITKMFTDTDISDKEYDSWKDRFEKMKEHEKIDNILGVVSQFILSPESKASASVMHIMLCCCFRWTEEKEIENDDF